MYICNSFISYLFPKKHIPKEIQQKIQQNQKSQLLIRKKKKNHSHWHKYTWHSKHTALEVRQTEYEQHCSEKIKFSYLYHANLWNFYEHHYTHCPHLQPISNTIKYSCCDGKLYIYPFLEPWPLPQGTSYKATKSTNNK